MAKIDLEKLNELRHKGFIEEIGIRTTEFREGYVKGEIEIGPKHMNPIGSVHGGVIFAFCDTLGGHAGTTYGRPLTTVNGSIEYLRPTMGTTKLIGETVELKRGKNICVYDVNVYNDREILVARATMTYYFLDEVADKKFSDGLKAIRIEKNQEIK